MQQIIRRYIDKSVQLFIMFQPGQQIDIVTPQLPPGGEQRITDVLFPCIVKQSRRLPAIAKQREFARFTMMTALA